MAWVRSTVSAELVGRGPPVEAKVVRFERFPMRYAALD